MDDAPPPICGHPIANRQGKEFACIRPPGHPGQVHWFLGGEDQGNGQTRFGLLATHPQNYTPTPADRKALQIAKEFKDAMVAMTFLQEADRKGEEL
jgi:hypothetical protein